MNTAPKPGMGPRERISRFGLLMHVLGVALILQVLLRFDLSRVLGWLDVERSDRVLDATAATELVAIINSVIARLGPLVGSICLTRTLTMFYYLRRRGVPLEVHLGIDHDGFDRHGFDAVADLRGHCWLVYEHAPVFERSDPRRRFRPIYRYFSRSNRQFNIPLEIVEEEAGEVIAALRSVIA